MGQLMEKGSLTKEDFQWGVIHLLGQLEEHRRKGKRV